ncbi:DinB family protein [Sphingobacterium hungaricum]
MRSKKSITEAIRIGRNPFIKLIDGLSEEELNYIPAGFNNNIIWNFGHIVVSTQILCYVRGGILPDMSSIKYAEDFKKGSKPTRNISASEIEELKNLALGTIAQLEADYIDGKLSSITPFSTETFGVEMNEIEEVLLMSLSHDTLHYGYALAQKRVLQKSID